jgi:hypothetical protein
MKQTEVCARILSPGDLIFSPRTEQLMLVLSVCKKWLTRQESPDFNEERIKLSWIPLGTNSRLMDTDVDPDNIYFRLQTCHRTHTEKS